MRVPPRASPSFGCLGFNVSPRKPRQNGGDYFVRNFAVAILAPATAPSATFVWMAFVSAIKDGLGAIAPEVLLAKYHQQATCHSVTW